MSDDDQNPGPDMHRWGRRLADGLGLARIRLTEQAFRKRYGLSARAGEIRRATRGLPAEQKEHLDDLVDKFVEAAGKDAKWHLFWGFILGILGNVLVNLVQHCLTYSCFP